MNYVNYCLLATLLLGLPYGRIPNDYVEYILVLKHLFYTQNQFDYLTDLK